MVATLGTALTREHVRLLKRLCELVLLVFDGDEAGQRAADRGVEMFFAEPIDVKICVLPDGLDPADLLGRDGGLARLREALAGADDALAYKVKRFRAQLAEATGLAGRQRRLEQLLSELAAMIENGGLAPRAPAVFPLERAGAVLTDLAERRLAGKAVLLPR